MKIPVIGERYGTRVIIDTSIDYDQGKERVTLRCDCGHESGTQFRYLLKGDGCKFCVRGQSRREIAFPIGYQHGFRKVIGYDRDKRFNSGIRVRCQCGHESTMESSNIRAGHGLACAKCAGEERKRLTRECPRFRPLKPRDKRIIELSETGMLQKIIAYKLGVSNALVSKVVVEHKKRQPV